MFGYSSRSGRTRPDFFCLVLLAVLGLGGFHTVHARATDSPQRSETVELPRIPLEINGHKLSVEVAASDVARAQGLMHREHLKPNHGMLFVFPDSTQMCFWMKNTPLPLTVAFIDASGRIISLADMQPYSLDPHCAIAPALYALEMEQGWFAGHKAKPGTLVHGLPKVKKRKPQSTN